VENNIRQFFAARNSISVIALDCVPEKFTEIAISYVIFTENFCMVYFGSLSLVCCVVYVIYCQHPFVSPSKMNELAAAATAHTLQQYAQYFVL
jgi:hypothetical protein